MRYEFGVKGLIVATLKEGLVVGARSMPGNPYDGYTPHEALEQLRGSQQWLAIGRDTTSPSILSKILTENIFNKKYLF